MKILKWLGIALLVVLVLLVLGVMVGKTIIEGKAAGMVAKQASEMLKVPVTIGAVRLDPFMGKVTVRDIKVGNPAGFSKEDIFELGSISVGVSYPALLKKQYVVKGIEIKKPQVRIEIDRRQKINAAVLMDNLPKEPKKAKKDEKPLPAFLVKKVRLTDGLVKITDAGFASGTAATSLDNIDFSLVNLTNMIARPKNAGEFKLTAKLNKKSPLDISGQIDAFAKKISFDLKAALKNVILTDFAPYYASAPVKIDRGSASLNINLPCRQEVLNGQGQVTASNLDIKSKSRVVGQASDSVTELLVDEKGQLKFTFPITGTLQKPNIGLMKVFSDLMGRAIAKGAQKAVQSEVTKSLKREVTKGIRLGF